MTSWNEEQRQWKQFHILWVCRSLVSAPAITPQRHIFCCSYVKLISIYALHFILYILLKGIILFMFSCLMYFDMFKGFLLYLTSFTSFEICCISQSLIVKQNAVFAWSSFMERSRSLLLLLSTFSINGRSPFFCSFWA